MRCALPWPTQRLQHSSSHVHAGEVPAPPWQQGRARPTQRHASCLPTQSHGSVQGPPIQHGQAALRGQPVNAPVLVLEGAPLIVSDGGVGEAGGGGRGGEGGSSSSCSCSCCCSCCLASHLLCASWQWGWRREPPPPPLAPCLHHAPKHVIQELGAQAGGCDRVVGVLCWAGEDHPLPGALHAQRHQCTHLAIPAAASAGTGGAEEGATGAGAGAGAGTVLPLLHPSCRRQRLPSWPWQQGED